ncbi:hypothetical protein AZH11_03935 [Pseudomonas simiae]|nr:hypothetical protein AZH11_03935 [Pseudomonas simiae]
MSCVSCAIGNDCGNAYRVLKVQGKRVFVHQQIPVALVQAIVLLFPATAQPLLKNPGHVLEKLPVGFF